MPQPDTPSKPLPRFPWQSAIARIILGVFGAVIAGGGIVHLLRDFFATGAAGAEHSDWVSFATMALGVVLVLLATDYQNRALAFFKGLPLPAWLKSSKGGE